MPLLKILTMIFRFDLVAKSAGGLVNTGRITNAWADACRPRPQFKMSEYYNGSKTKKNSWWRCCYSPTRPPTKNKGEEYEKRT